MKRLYIYLLLLPCSFFAMEPPEKRICIHEEETKQVVFNPQSLQELSGQQVASHYLLYCNVLDQIPKPVQAKYLHPRLLKIIKGQLENEYKSRYKLTHQSAKDSECYFDKTGDHIISIHASDKIAEIFNKKKIKEEDDFKPSTILNNLPSGLICFSPENRLYVCDMHNIKEYCINYGQVDAYFSVPFQKRISPKIDAEVHKIFPRIPDGILAVVETSGWLPIPSIHAISRLGKSEKLCTYDSGEKIHTVYSLSGNGIATIFDDGKIHTLHMLDFNSKQSRFMMNFMQGEDSVLDTAYNPESQNLAISFNNKNFAVYNVHTQVERFIKYPFLNSIYHLTFYDPEHIILMHTPKVDIRKDNKFSLYFFNWVHEKMIASSTQNETIQCNTITVSPDKKDLVVGMGYYDVCVHDLNSFEFNPEVISLEKVCHDPYLWKDLSVNAQMNEMYQCLRKTIEDELVELEMMNKKYDPNYIPYTTSEKETIVAKTMYETYPEFWKTFIDKKLSVHEKIRLVNHYLKKEDQPIPAPIPSVPTDPPASPNNLFHEIERLLGIDDES